MKKVKLWRDESGELFSKELSLKISHFMRNANCAMCTLYLECDWDGKERIACQRAIESLFHDIRKKDFGRKLY